MELFLSIALGIGLSAACGFRIFVPFTVMSAAAMSGYLHLAPDFAWIGDYPALLTFASATLIEVLAYYIPWVDNLLDALATPAAVVAGTIATASVMVSDMSPMMTWTLALIAGGGTAGIVQAGTTVLRGMSSMATGGLGNFLVATGEFFGAVITSLLTILFPLLAILFVVVLILLIWQQRRQRKNALTPTASLTR